MHQVSLINSIWKKKKKKKKREEKRKKKQEKKIKLIKTIILNKIIANLII